MRCPGSIGICCAPLSSWRATSQRVTPYNPASQLLRTPNAAGQITPVHHSLQSSHCVSNEVAALLKIACLQFLGDRLLSSKAPQEGGAHADSLGDVGPRLQGAETLQRVSSPPLTCSSRRV